MKILQLTDPDSDYTRISIFRVIGSGNSNLLNDGDYDANNACEDIGLENIKVAINIQTIIFFSSTFPLRKLKFFFVNSF